MSRKLIENRVKMCDGIDCENMIKVGEDSV